MPPSTNGQVRDATQHRLHSVPPACSPLPPLPPPTASACALTPFGPGPSWLAAYLLDSTPRSSHFSRVPPTAIVHVEHSAFFDAQKDGATNACGLRSRKTKVGSLQQFVPHDGFAEDFSQSLFSHLEVQRIAVLDVRTFNTDRHAANLLVLKPSAKPAPAFFPHAEGGAVAGRQADGADEAVTDQYRLVPIDHGFCLPAAITVPCFEWAHWPQAKAPMQPEVLAYIAAIDVDADAALLTNGGALPSNANSCCGSLSGSLAPSPSKAAAPAGATFGGGAMQGGMQGGHGEGGEARPSSPLAEPPSHGDNKRPMQDAINARHEPKLMRPRSVSMPSDPLRGLHGGAQGRERFSAADGQPRDGSPLGQLRAGCVTTLRVGTLMLTKAAEHGLTLSQLADFMCEPASRSQAAQLLAVDEPHGGAPAAGGRSGGRPPVRRSLLAPSPSARPCVWDGEAASTAPSGFERTGVQQIGGLWSASDMKAAAAAAAEAAASRAGAKETLTEAGIEAETERLQRIALMRRDRSYLAIPSAEAEEVEAEAEAEARATAERAAWLRTQAGEPTPTPGPTPGEEAAAGAEAAWPPPGLRRVGRGHSLKVEVHSDGSHEEESEAAYSGPSPVEHGATPLSQAATAEKRPDRQARGGGRACVPAGGPDLDADGFSTEEAAGGAAGLAAAVSKRRSGGAAAGGAESACTGCSPVSIFAGCGPQLAETPDLGSTHAGSPPEADPAAPSAMPSAAAGPGADDGGHGAQPDKAAAMAHSPAPMTIDVSQSWSSSVSSSLSNSCTAPSSLASHPVTATTLDKMSGDGQFTLDLASPPSPGSDTSGGAPLPSIHLQASPTSSASPVFSLRPSPQGSPDRTLDVGELPDAMELGPSVTTAASPRSLSALRTAEDDGGARALPSTNAAPSATTSYSSALPRGLPPIAPGATAAELPVRQMGFFVPSLTMAAGCGKLALDTVPEDGPTGLQILCETARAEALRRTYPSFRNGGGEAGAAAALSPQRRDRISERVFIQILARRVATHFAQIGDAAVGERNMRAVRAAQAAAAQAQGQEGIDGRCCEGGPSCRAAVEAARAVVEEETSPNAPVDVGDGASSS